MINLVYNQKMKNKKSILIVVGILILLLLLFFVWKFTNKKPAEVSLSTQGQQQTTQKSNEEATASDVNGNVFDLIKLGKTLKCTYSMATQDVTISGTTYVSGENMRGDFENTEPNGTKIQSHMISDGEWVYTWTSASPQGIKMNITKAQSEGSASNADSTTTNQNANTFKNNVDFKCLPWIEDASVFQVPTDIKFTDFTAPSANTNSNSNATVCSACDQAPTAEAKAACKKQLGCQ